MHFTVISALSAEFQKQEKAHPMARVRLFLLSGLLVLANLKRFPVSLRLYHQQVDS